ncbi:conserved hypothetical protein [Streptomyces clavuligerus]|uniref:Uncharacterized protein n=1 Tax=Streptomyces clavuligerus TaxID=1901 RepID=Q6TMQ6_STRCL|nr:hypothetical protein pSCL2.6.A8.13c [Streptomyces clavuligerus]EDY48717.1 conserved hypothetical protein [Streptomyces clavuligerus]
MSRFSGQSERFTPFPALPVNGFTLRGSERPLRADCVVESHTGNRSGRCVLPPVNGSSARDAAAELRGHQADRSRWRRGTGSVSAGP